MSEPAKQVDLVWRDQKNRVVSIEIAGSAEHEVHNALYCLSCEDVRKHVVVCLDKKILAQVKEKFAEFPLLLNDERVEILTLAQVLSESWSPLDY